MKSISTSATYLLYRLADQRRAMLLSPPGMNLEQFDQLIAILCVTGNNITLINALTDHSSPSYQDDQRFATDYAHALEKNLFSDPFRRHRLAPIE